MTIDLKQPCARWRESLGKIRERGEALEAFARELGLVEFECRAEWWGLTIDQCEHGDTLQEFSARVTAIAEKLGRAPDSCEADHGGSQYSSEQAPDLRAKWEFKGRKIGDSEASHTFTVLVRTLGPRGCKVDPSTDYVEKQEQSIHPECKAVLASLEDL